MSRATTRTYGVLYLIRCDQNGLYKIGITNKWALSLSPQVACN